MYALAQETTSASSQAIFTILGMTIGDIALLAIMIFVGLITFFVYKSSKIADITEKVGNAEAGIQNVQNTCNELVSKVDTMFTSLLERIDATREESVRAHEGIGTRIDNTRTEINGNIDNAEKRLRDDIKQLRDDNKSTDEKVNSVLISNANTNSDSKD